MSIHPKRYVSLYILWVSWTSISGGEHKINNIFFTSLKNEVFGKLDMS